MLTLLNAARKDLASSRRAAIVRWATVITGLMLALSACSSPGQMRNMNHEVDLHGYHSYSWGKAGVNFKDYTHVLFECGSRAAMADTHVNAPDFSFAGLADPLDAAVNRVEQARVAVQIEDDRQRHAILDGCLTQFGYRRFGLTDAQLARLDTLPHGSVERREYLFSLGSDAQVLQHQGI